MNLTKNEKKVLKLLLGNARKSDSDIAAELGISSQAVGKIRRKLEESMIEGYTLKLNPSKLGLETHAIGIAKLTREGQDMGELEVEQMLHENPHVTNVYRLPQGNATHILVYSFRDLNELDSFFHSQKVRQGMHRYLELQQLFTFSHHSMVKSNHLPLFEKTIDSLGVAKEIAGLKELELFKRRL